MALPLGEIQLIVVSCITVAMAIVATMLRLWSRYLQNQSLVSHDYLALAGILFTLATVAVLVAGESLHYNIILPVCLSEDISPTFTNIVTSQADSEPEWGSIHTNLWQLARRR